MSSVKGHQKSRGQAWRWLGESAHNGKRLPSGFKALAQPFQLADPERVEDLAAILPTGRGVIIDTMNRSAPGQAESLEA
jgi:hypothetical protein